MCGLSISFPPCSMRAIFNVNTRRIRPIAPHTDKNRNAYSHTHTRAETEPNRRTNNSYSLLPISVHASVCVSVSVCVFVGRFVFKLYSCFLLDIPYAPPSFLHLLLFRFVGPLLCALRLYHLYFIGVSCSLSCVSARVLWAYRCIRIIYERMEPRHSHSLCSYVSVCVWRLLSNTLTDSYKQFNTHNSKLSLCVCVPLFRCECSAAGLAWLGNVSFIVYPTEPRSLRLRIGIGSSDECVISHRHIARARIQFHYTAKLHTHTHRHIDT